MQVELVNGGFKLDYHGITFYSDSDDVETVKTYFTKMIQEDGAYHPIRVFLIQDYTSPKMKELAINFHVWDTSLWAYPSRSKILKFIEEIFGKADAGYLKKMLPEL